MGSAEHAYVCHLCTPQNRTNFTYTNTLTPCYTGTRYSGLFAITDDPLCFWYFTANLISYTGQICKPDRTEIPPTEKIKYIEN